MSKPTDKFTWATDPAFDDAGKPWDGVPPKLDPGAGLKLQGWKPARRMSARFLNWLFGVCGAWITYLDTRIDADDELVYETPKVRGLSISPVGRIVSGQSKIVGGAAAGVLTQGQSLDNGWRSRELALVGGGPGGTDTYSPASYVRTSLPQHVGYIDLTPELRSGMVILAVDVTVDPGTAQATASDRMKWRLAKRNLTGFAASSTVASANADNTGDQQHVAATGLAETVDLSTYAYWLEVWSSAGADSTPDDLYGVTLGVEDPGPRNF